MNKTVVWVRITGKNIVNNHEAIIFNSPKWQGLLCSLTWLENARNNLFLSLVLVSQNFIWREGLTHLHSLIHSAEVTFWSKGWLLKNIPRRLVMSEYLYITCLRTVGVIPLLKVKNAVNFFFSFIFLCVSCGFGAFYRF